jgi:hypothetical protein
MMEMVLAEAQKDEARLSGQELFEAAPKSKEMTQEETLRESLARAEIEVKQAQDALEKKNSRGASGTAAAGHAAGGGC